MTKLVQVDVTFRKSGRGAARCPPDPAYPEGMIVCEPFDADPLGEAKETCPVELTYPAPECGYHVVRCLRCPNSIAISAAGRVDDPHTLLMVCKAPWAEGVRDEDKQRSKI